MVAPTCMARVMVRFQLAQQFAVGVALQKKGHTW
jgi:hypothetical protein